MTREHYRTNADRERIRRDKEESLERGIREVHRRIHNDTKVNAALGVNGSLYLFCGLIMAGLGVDGTEPLTPSDLTGNDDVDDNDGTIILDRAKTVMLDRKCTTERAGMVLNHLRPVFRERSLWTPVDGGSAIRSVYGQVEKEILPLIDGDTRLDFTGMVLNILGDSGSVDDRFNDVVLTPRAASTLMARITRTDMDSFVWDTCMGSSGLLVSAMDVMVEDARGRMEDSRDLDEKVSRIMGSQLFGVELRSSIYVLAVLNSVILGDGSSPIVCGDSHEEAPRFIRDHRDTFPANVFLLNPPYSAPGKGLVFAEEGLSNMLDGYGVVLIQENAGSGQGDGCAKQILERNTLVASVHMPPDLFGGKASVQTAIYLFRVNRPHKADDIVTFVDFSNDGYIRQNQKRSTKKSNLRDVDHAIERYDEVAAICLGEEPATGYYTEDNGLVIRDTISLDGDDWTFRQHVRIDTTPTDDDFRKVVADYLAWKVGAILKGELNADA